MHLDLSRWIGKAVDDGLTSEQALAELRGRAVPWQPTPPDDASSAKSARVGKASSLSKALSSPSGKNSRK